jgi:excisionase family DNA binding protein
MALGGTPQRLLKPAEVAEVLGVSRSKAYALISEGRLPAIRVTGSVRVPADALEQWIATNTVPPMGG